jgi:hypothetical protein
MEKKSAKELYLLQKGKKINIARAQPKNKSKRTR